MVVLGIFISSMAQCSKEDIPVLEEGFNALRNQ
jgi:hypothetical protein